MQSYNIPRNYKGEGRLLYVFSTKALVTMAIGLVVGLPIYYIFKLIGLSMVGIVFAVLCAAIGYAVGTFKVPNAAGFEITKKTAGENIDDVIIRWIKFKKKRNRIYVYDNIEEVTKDEH